MILTFGELDLLRLDVSKSYIWVFFLHFVVDNSYVLGVDFLRLRVSNSYVCV